jgi:hypothetical protein
MLQGHEVTPLGRSSISEFQQQFLHALHEIREKISWDSFQAIERLNFNRHTACVLLL